MTVHPVREVSVDNESWKSVPGYEGLYEVSDVGRVRRLESRVKTGFGVRTLPAREIATTPADGYRRVNLWSGNKYKQFQVHRLVMLAFMGNSELSVDHLNGVRDDNRLANLSYCSLAENTLRQHAAGRSVIVRGERNGKSKLTADKVKIARLLRQKGFKLKDIAERVGVTRETISAVLNNRTWKHVV